MILLLTYRDKEKSQRVIKNVSSYEMDSCEDVVYLQISHQPCGGNAKCEDGDCECPSYDIQIAPDLLAEVEELANFPAFAREEEKSA